MGAGGWGTLVCVSSGFSAVRARQRSVLTLGVLFVTSSLLVALVGLLVHRPLAIAGALGATGFAVVAVSRVCQGGPAGRPAPFAQAATAAVCFVLACALV